MPEPTVSVIIPTYNRAHVLPRALDSVLAQTYGEYEVLVVDDGSSDGTDVLMAGYGARDGRIRYLVQPRNAGVSAARNRGMREARGRYLAFLDSDDEWMPEKLARQVAHFDALPPAVGLVSTGVETVGEESWTFEPAHRGDLYPVLCERNVLHGTSGVMVRREAIERVGGFDEGIPAAEDWDLWIRVARHYEVDFVPEPLIRYHDPQGEDRKSLETRENLEARAWIYRKHGAEMRRLGTAHRFLMTSARRHLRPGVEDRAGARALALQAARLRPLSPDVFPLAVRLGLQRLLPASGYGLLRRGNALVRSARRRLRGTRGS